MCKNIERRERRRRENYLGKEEIIIKITNEKTTEFFIEQISKTR